MTSSCRCAAILSALLAASVLGAADRDPLDALREGSVRAARRSIAVTGELRAEIRVSGPSGQSAVVAGDGSFRIGGLPVNRPLRVDLSASGGSGAALVSDPATLDAANGFSARAEISPHAAGAIRDVALRGASGRASITLSTVGSSEAVSVTGVKTNGDGVDRLLGTFAS